MNREDIRKRARDTFIKGMHNLPYNSLKSYFMITCNSGCEVYIPSRFNDEGMMLKEKQAYQVLAQHADF